MAVRHQKDPRNKSLSCLCGAVFFLLFLVALPAVFADVLLDGSLGPAGPVGPGALADGSAFDYLISHDMGRQVGTNLFHSFASFSLDTYEKAAFTGPGIIDNIISRVTGGAPSTIDGLLRSAIEGSNLFFLNPAGVMFGPHASLDVPGAFHVSTAEYLRLRDGGVFHSVSGQPSLLSVAPPSAFGFVNPDAGGIEIRGATLRVPKARMFSAIGGEVEIIGGTIQAPGGTINLASVASPGEVIPAWDGDGAGSLEMSSFANLGTIDLSAESRLSVSGDRSGNIFIRGGDFRLDRSSISSFGYLDGGNIDIRVSGGFTLSNESWIVSDIFGSGEAGDILLDVGLLDLSGNSRITSHAMDTSTGKAGDITIRAAESVHLSTGHMYPEGQTYISSSTFGDGDAGRISIETPSLTIEDRAGIFTLSYMGFDTFGNVVGGGNGGDIWLNVDRLDIANAGIGSQAGPLTTGQAGNITVRARESVTLRDESAIHSGTDGRGNAGTISVETPLLALEFSGIDVDTGPYATGNAGHIDLKVRNLMLTDVAQISASSHGPGQGGSISVEAEELISITGRNSEGYQSAILSSAFGQGDGGAVSLQAKTLLIDGGAVAAQNAGAAATGGDISIRAETVNLKGGAQISSVSFGAGKGGNVTVRAQEAITLSGRDAEGLRSGITTGAADGEGGDILLEAALLEVSDGAVISAESSGAGDAGDIRIDAKDAFTLRDASVSTSAERADGGNIQVNARRLVRLSDSTLAASVGGGPETLGGNITMDSEYVVLDGSRIAANAYEGKGGNIQIAAEVCLMDSNSEVDASSARGIDGEVNIQAPITEISGSLAPLQEDFRKSTMLLREPCLTRMIGGQYSSFHIKGRGALPLEPGGLLPSPSP